MSLQLICRNQITDYDAWRAAFDDDREAQQEAGLSLLQLWRSAEGSNEVVYLFRVNSRERAADWIARARNGLVSDAQRGGEYLLVETA